MAWTANRTWVTGEIPTAATFNTYVRDNLDETCPATATTAGDIVYADAANSMGSRLGIGTASSLLASDGSGPVWRRGGGMQTNAAYTTLTTSGTFNKLGNATFFAYPAQVEVEITTGTRVVVFVKGNMRSDTAGAITWLSYSISGATTTAAAEQYGVAFESSNANDSSQQGSWHYATTTAGSNTFTLEAKMTAGLSTLKNVAIYVMPL